MIAKTKKYLKNFGKKITARIGNSISLKSNYKFFIRDWTRLKDLELCGRVLETKRFSRNLAPIEVDCPKAKRILVISPHEDDDILGAGGTILKLRQQGASVHVIYVARHLDLKRAHEVRKETLKISKMTGTIPHFLDCTMNNIPLDNHEINTKLSNIYREVEPEVLFTSFLMDDHDDHRRVNELLIKALDTKVNCELWAYQVYSTVPPNVVVDISAVAERKRELIRIWRSISGDRDWAHYMLGINAANSRYISSKDPVYAETFFVLPIQEYFDLCNMYFKSDKAYYSRGYKNN